MPTQIGSFPRIYRPSWGARCVVLTLAAIWFPAAFYTFNHLWILNEPSSEYDRVVTSIVWVLTSCSMVGSIAAVTRNRIVLKADSVEAVSIFRTRRLMYDQIGARRRAASLVPTWLIFSERRSETTIEIGLFYNFDHVFWEWLATIPMVDDKFRESQRAQRQTGPQ